MPTAMTNDTGVKQKSLRIQLPTDDVPVVPPTTAVAPHTTPKSILRNGRNDATTNATELSSPLQSESYFLGPLRTLVASIEEKGSGFVSIHDITEAYILLSCRIEAQAANLVDDDATPAVLSVRKLPSHVICAAIRRDVAYALPERNGSNDLCSSQVRMTDEERSCIKDQSNLCHAALRFLASFLRFPSLHQTLKLHERTWILKETLDIGLCNDLVTINPQKTYSHVLGVLCSERLSDSVLKPLRTRISSVVERAASGTLGGNASNGPHIEGLKVIYALLHRHGSLLFPEFSGIFKVVLQNLVCPMPAFRDLAAKVLTAFAHAILRYDVSIEDQHKFSSIVDAFIDKETRRAKNVSKSERSPFVLRCFLNLSEDDPNLIKRVTQLLNIVAALLVISGPCVFIRPNSLKFLIKAVGKTQNFRYRELNVLRAATWSCLVRAYGLLSSWDIPRYDGLEESAFRVVRQEYREDVSVSVLAVLLGVNEETTLSLGHVHEAINYLHHLGQMPETRTVATKLLRRLLGGVFNDDSDMCTWTSPASVVPDWLSNGSTLEMEPRTLRKSLSSLRGTDIRVVRNLEADELIAVWQHIADAFQVCAIGQLFDKKTENALQDDIVLLWHVFLRIKSSLDPTFNPTVVAKPELERLASVLCAILDTPDTRYPIRPVQAFEATHQLWKLVNDEFGLVWGSALASSIYRRLLKAFQYEGAGNTLSDECVQLSRSLISASPKRTMEILAELHDVDAQRVIWLDMVRYTRFQERPSKETILHLLLFPLQVSEDIMKEQSDIGYWDMLFLLSLMHNEPEVIFSAVAEEIHRALSFKACTEVRKFLKISVTHASRSESLPSVALLSAVNDYLEESYPPDGNGISELVELVPFLQKLVTACNGIDALLALRNGLTPWFEDRRLSIPDVIYNNDVLPLYCDAVHVIRRVSPIEEIVVDLADVLAAPFQRERIPKPAVGPVAFKEFWDSVGPTLNFSPQSFPPVLIHCITSLNDAFGVYVPDWMTSQIESEKYTSDEELIIPPSIEDSPSPDFSPISSKRPAKADDKSYKRKNTKVTPCRTPEVSPSIGEPSPHFARYHPGVMPTSPSASPGLMRAKKKRKQSGTNSEIFQRGSTSVYDLRQASPRHKDEGRRDHEFSAAEIAPSPSRQEVSIHPPASDEDYTSWEVDVSSQDVRDILEDNDETARPLDSPPEITDNASGRASMRSRGKNREQPQVSAENPIDRSQTAPACLQSSSEERQCPGEISLSEQYNVAAKLRRTHTTTDVPLDALEKLHTRLSEEADSMQTQDLAQATRLTYDVLGILNGRMSEKLRKRN